MMIKSPPGYRFDPFADARMGRSLFQMSPEDWLVRDSDGSGEAGETGTGSTEGDSAGRSASEGIAPPAPPSSPAKIAKEQ